MRKLKKMWKVVAVSFVAVIIATTALWTHALADAGCVAALSGYQIGRFVFDNGGCAHLNGSDIYDGVDKPYGFARATYDFAVQGGGTTQFNLGILQSTAQTLTIPSGAVIVDGVLDVVTAPDNTNVATQIQISSEATGDILTTTPGSIQSGRKALSPTTAATSIKTTAARVLTMKITGASLTSGKFVVALRYFMGG